MESSDGRYGWAADDPRWTDELAGGRGRLEPSPAPRFGTGEASPDSTELTTAEPDAPEGGAGGAPVAGSPPRPLDLPPWPPAPPGPPAPDPQATSPQAPPTSIDGAPPDPAPGSAPPVPASESAPAEPLLRSVPPAEPLLPPVPPAVRGLFGPPLAIGAAPVPPSPGPPAPRPGANGHGPTPALGPFVGAASVPSPAPTSVPLRVHTQLPAPSGIELHTGYGLTAGTARPADGGDLVRAARTTRLERRVRIRSRWSTEDEFRRAARAELFSDDARYRVLFALTAGWYGPVALIYLVWVVLVSGDAGASGVIGGLLWLAAAAAVSLGVAGLLRWASVGWRALSLSAAAAIIGGGITTIAHTLTG